MRKPALVAILAAIALSTMSAATFTTTQAKAYNPDNTPSVGPTSTPPIVTDSGGTSGTTSVGTNDGQTVTVPWAGGTIVTNGDTQNSTTMPSIHKLLSGCDVLKTWGDLVACVDKNNAQWYRDGINRYAARSGISWDDVVKWSTAKTVDGKTPEARIIMLTGKMRDLKDVQAVNDRVKDLTGNANLQVWPLTQSGYTNTWRAGTETSPDMTTFVDYNDEVRVSLVPLVLDANGNVTNLNTQLRFSGVFVDCFNDHWLDVFTPPTPSIVVCPPGSTLAGQPLPSNGYAGCTPSTPPTTPSNAKNPKDSVNAVQGTTPRSQNKPVTNGKASSDQKSTGATSGNVTDKTVPVGTGSGTTTSDLGSTGGTASGAKAGGDSAAGTSSGAGQTSTNTGGTSGGTVITDPQGP